MQTPAVRKSESKHFFFRGIPTNSIKNQKGKCKVQRMKKPITNILFRTILKKVLFRQHTLCVCTG